MPTDSSPSHLDIIANRKAKKWSRKELVGRALWEMLRGPLFSWTPRLLWSWRRGILRVFGAHIGRNVHVFPSVKIAVPWNLRMEDNAAIGDCAIIYNLGLVTIGRDTTISQYVHICAGTHDFHSPEMPLVKSPITIGDGAWICADSFVGPGVTIGRMAIVGARAVVVKEIAENAIVAGNPARVVGVRLLRDVR